MYVTFKIRHQGCAPQNCETKMDILRGLYRIYFFVFLPLLKVFIPHLEILFCINHYFLLCKFKWHISLRKCY